MFLFLFCFLSRVVHFNLSPVQAGQHQLTHYFQPFTLNFDSVCVSVCVCAVHLKKAPLDNGALHLGGRLVVVLATVMVIIGWLTTTVMMTATSQLQQTVLPVDTTTSETM